MQHSSTCAGGFSITATYVQKIKLHDHVIGVKDVNTIGAMQDFSNVVALVLDSLAMGGMK